MAAPFIASKFNLSDYDDSTGKEMSLDKFSAICQESRKWFFYDTFRPTIPILLISVEDAAENLYLKSIKNTVENPLSNQSVWNPEIGSKNSYEDIVQHVRQTVMEFSGIVLKLKRNRANGMLAPLTAINLRQDPKYSNALEIPFWHFLASAQNDTSDEQTAKADELARLLCFTEPMLRDWHKAVDYVLSGNIFNDECIMKFESEEAKCFFLHIYDRSDLWHEY